MKRTSRAANGTTLRHLWLASLGLAVMARREALAAGVQVIGHADALQRRVRGQVEPRVVQFSAEVEARLAPVLEKLGLKPAKAKRPQRVTRKVAKPVRRAARKP
ncbi:hypothetical protein ACFOLC_12385 [Lysobacter cavernae]|uniref:Uncharacterized protein n=1 Tax=Lysobacter cavernae TaxID=1685901 RepID=A0ABV7RSZ1_9GAMM